jgi:adenine/guanine phosphoribosyltransferase-like PRPP-binding protein
MRSANTANDHDWIVENFVPAERAEIQKMLGYESVEERNQAYYKTVRKVEIIGTAMLKGYAILLVQDQSDGGGGRKVAVTLTKTTEGWKQR